MNLTLEHHAERRRTHYNADDAIKPRGLGPDSVIGRPGEVKMISLSPLLFLAASAARASTVLPCTAELCPSEFVPDSLSEAPLVLAVEALETTLAQDMEVSAEHIETLRRNGGGKVPLGAKFARFRVTEVVRGDDAIEVGSVVMVRIYTDRTGSVPTVGDVGLFFGRQAPWAPVVEDVPLLQFAHPLEWGYISKTEVEDDSGATCSAAVFPWSHDYVVSASLTEGRIEELRQLGAASPEDLSTGSLMLWSGVDNFTVGPPPCDFAPWAAFEEEVRSW